MEVERGREREGGEGGREGERGRGREGGERERERLTVKLPLTCGGVNPFPPGQLLSGLHSLKSNTSAILF